MEWFHHQFALTLKCLSHPSSERENSLMRKVFNMQLRKLFPELQHSLRAGVMQNTLTSPLAEELGLCCLWLIPTLPPCSGTEGFPLSLLNSWVTRSKHSLPQPWPYPVMEGTKDKPCLAFLGLPLWGLGSQSSTVSSDSEITFPGPSTSCSGRAGWGYLELQGLSCSSWLQQADKSFNVPRLPTGFSNVNLSPVTFSYRPSWTYRVNFKPKHESTILASSAPVYQFVTIPLYPLSI